MNVDDSVIALLDPAQRNALESWTSLTDSCLSDEDSILFMRDFVCILVKNSLRKEEEYIHSQEATWKNLQEVGIRTDLEELEKFLSYIFFCSGSSVS